ncbi:hypothetical protein NW757_012229 [Fusarium falciforme]|nr:hypothetical protein NW757_012229 [Fusarium falciforme]
MASPDLAHPSRKILLVVTTGGFTHASPVFEIGSVLAARGHTVEFSTLDGQEYWTEGYDFITKVRSLGPSPTPEQMNAHYLRMRTWDISKGISGVMDSKYLFDSFWPQTYRGLKAIMDDPDTRPRQMRRENGVTYPPHHIQKPDCLVFVNSFLGLEIPRDLPPTCAPVGPLISDTYPPLDEECDRFLTRHTKVIYMALGTHIILTNADATKIINGLLHLLEEGLIDGVIWSIAKSARQDLDVNTTYETSSKGDKTTLTLGHLLSGKHPDWLCSVFVPQRAILDHPSTKIYFTHGGGSSANESLFHGKPMLSMGVFIDQISNTARLVAGGVAESLNKFRFTSEELYTKGKKILADEDGSYERNTLRLTRIARVASRRKHHAADLVEELVYDTELRFRDGKELRPMHLQTADMRMSVWRAKNWDLWVVSLVGVSAVLGGLGMGGRMLWWHRGVLVKAVMGSPEWLRSLVR